MAVSEAAVTVPLWRRAVGALLLIVGAILIIGSFLTLLADGRADGWVSIFAINLGTGVVAFAAGRWLMGSSFQWSGRATQLGAAANAPPGDLAQTYKRTKWATIVAYAAFGSSIALALLTGSSFSEGPVATVTASVFVVAWIAFLTGYVFLWKLAKLVGKSPIVYVGGAILLNSLFGLGLAIMVSTIAGPAKQAIEEARSRA
jgi:uncharacterized MAPEG superfamily protein